MSVLPAYLMKVTAVILLDLGRNKKLLCLLLCLTRKVLFFQAFLVTGPGLWNSLHNSFFCQFALSIILWCHSGLNLKLNLINLHTQLNLILVTLIYTILTWLLQWIWFFIPISQEAAIDWCCGHCDNSTIEVIRSHTFKLGENFGMKMNFFIGKLRHEAVLYVLIFRW